MSGPQQPFDAEQFKAQQSKIWDNAAAGWQSWWSTFEKGAQQVSDKLVELAQIKEGDRVLDVATGIGEPAVTAAKRVRPSGKVIATDISSQMIAIAMARAKSLGLESIIEFRQLDTEKLDFPKASFNAILSRWGMMFLPNLQSALITMRMLLVPGGRFATAVWSTPSKVPLLDQAFSVIRAQVNAPPPPPGVPGPFALANPELLTTALKQAGFTDISVQRFDVTFSFDSAESVSRFHQQISAPLQIMLANQTEEKKKQAWDALTEATRKYADPAGRVTITNEVICVAGKAV